MRAAEAVAVIGVAIIAGVLGYQFAKHIVLALIKWRSSEAKWEANYHVRDGQAVVVVERPGEERVVKQLKAGPSPLDFQSDLENALQDAELEAETLNRHR